MWNLLIILLLIYTALVLPVRFSFIDNDSNWKSLDYVIDGIFCFDVIINFVSAYENDAGILIFKRKEIIIKFFFKIWKQD